MTPSTLTAGAEAIRNRLTRYSGRLFGRARQLYQLHKTVQLVQCGTRRDGSRRGARHRTSPLYQLETIYQLVQFYDVD